MTCFRDEPALEAQFRSARPVAIGLLSTVGPSPSREQIPVPWRGTGALGHIAKAVPCGT